MAVQRHDGRFDSGAGGADSGALHAPTLPGALRTGVRHHYLLDCVRSDYELVDIAKYLRLVKSLSAHF